MHNRDKTKVKSQNLSSTCLEQMPFMVDILSLQSRKTTVQVITIMMALFYSVPQEITFTEAACTVYYQPLFDVIKSNVIFSVLANENVHREMGSRGLVTKPPYT